MRTLTVLGASIAHQLRNAVTGCRMALDLHVAENHSGESAECLEVAKRQLQLMESQLQRFLRVGKQPQTLVMEDVDLGELVDELLPLVRPAAKHAGVALEFRITSQPIVVRGDGEALGQVVLNLLLNAVEAAQQGALKLPGKGRVEVEVGRNGDDMAELLIADSGGGPSEAIATMLFEPFVTSKPEGAGLGLAVAKEVVAEHGGSIDWNRENGMTRFRVKLPMAAGSQLSAVGHRQESAALPIAE
jgi:signal transduction histidine kinase